MTHTLFVILFLFSFAASAQQCLLYPVSLQQRTANSDLVVEGKILEKTSFWNQKHTSIFTANLLEVHKVFKGTTTVPYLIVVTEGGRVGDEAQVVRPNLELSTEDYGVFFLNHDAGELTSRAASDKYPYIFCRDYAGPQTFVRYHGGKAADIFFDYANDNEIFSFIAEMSANTDAAHFAELKPTPSAYLKPVTQQGLRAAPTISSFSPSNVKAGTLSSASLLTINGNNFGATRGTSYIQFRDADDGGASYVNAAIAADYQSWTNTQIIVRVPDGAGTGTFQVVVPGGSGGTATSASALTVDYSCISIVSSGVRYEPDLVNDNGSNGYTLTNNTSFAGNASALASYRRALSSWTTATKVNFTEAGTTSSVSTASNDGVNIVTFANLSAGVLGVSSSNYGGCSPDGSNWYWYVSDIDLRFEQASDVNWCYGTAAPTSSQYDFESVALHELGHHHQLGHVINSGAVMHYAIANGQQSRTLSANDIAGGNYVLSHSTTANPCGPTPMVLLLPVELLSFTGKKMDEERIELSWKTASEYNSDYFILERSTDGTIFEPVAKIKAAGNSANTRYYSYEDNNVRADVVYYRLLQSSFSGDAEHSKIISVRNNNRKSRLISVAPNPSEDGKFLLQYTAEKSAPLKIKVYDLMGKTVSAQFVESYSNYNQTFVDLTACPSGIYFLSVQQGDEVTNVRLVKE